MHADTVLYVDHPPMVVRVVNFNLLALNAVGSNPDGGFRFFYVR